MARLRWFFARALDSVGLTTAVAWLLLFAIVLYVLIVLLPAQQKLSTLEQQLSAMPETQQVTYINTTPSDQFLSQIPRIGTVTASIQQLFDVANKQNIAINEIVYKDEHAAGDMVTRYSMSFSVDASYPEIKAFIVETLATLPNMALEQLTFERDERDSSVIASHLQFTLYLVR